MNKLENFVRLLHEVQRVTRRARRPDEDKMSTTAEHMFQLAMTCWYIASTSGLELDHEKILKYSLAHDIVEAYAGDTVAYDKEARKTKEDREAAAMVRLEKEFPEFPDLLTTIREYESLSTPEAKLVYAADKLIDPLDTSMEKVKSLNKEFGISWEDMINYKSDKIAISDAIVPYWQQLLKKFEARKDFFFGE